MRLTLSAAEMRETAEEFEKGYAERSGISVEGLRREGHVVHPCDCGEEGCEGWQMVDRKLFDRIAAMRD